MRIEKVNDHQIRCTLTKADLADRELKISELAYGTEKAKTLFRDMMQEAALKFGFEAEDIPLMIEAIPLNPDCIVLIITKVEDPEELDTRFSKFAPSAFESDEDGDSEDILSDLSGTANDVLDLFKKIHEGRMAGMSEASASDKASETDAAPQKEDASPKTKNSTQVFAFASIHDVIQLARATAAAFTGQSILYKDEEAGRYLLVLESGEEFPYSFNSVCSVASEYGVSQQVSNAGIASFGEHYSTIIAASAIQALAQI